MGKFLPTGFSEATFSWAASTRDNIAYWVTEQKRVLILVLCDDARCGSSYLFTVLSTLGSAATVNRGDHWGGATLGTGGGEFSLGGAVPVVVVDTG